MAGGAKREACRNFLRGSCTYGARCKFLHSTPPLQQQQHSSKPNNPFGFGTQQQQQSSNPFGFGTQQQKQQQQSSKNPFGFGTLATTAHSQQTTTTTPFLINNNNKSNTSSSSSKPNQFKPFENKWSRFSQTNNAGSQLSRQPDTHPSSIHKCTDPDTCKRLIIEDFDHEKPLWKITCYGHNKSAPCDIVGDMSYEELRAAAYSDAGRGLSLQSIVERERSIVHAKLQEFESLLRNPYVPKDSFRTTQISFPGVGGTSQLPTTTPNNNPPSVSSFSQLGGSLNGGFGTTPATNAFGQQASTQSPNQAHSGFAMNTLQFGNTGAFGFQNANQPLGNVGKGSAANLEQKTSLFPLVSSQIATSGIVQPPLFPTPLSSASTAVKSEPRENEAADNAIWLMEWKRGEVPEEAPPDKYISSM